MRKLYRLGIVCIIILMYGGCAQGDLPSSAPEEISLEEARNTAAEPAEKRVYLTFDDGPYKNTEKLLDILKEYEVPAAFFVVGSEKDYAPELYRRIVEEGHVLANHTYSHVYKNIYSGWDELKAELEKLEDYVMEKSGCEVEKIFRFPGGSNHAEKLLGKDMKERLKEWGYRVFDWNCSGEDAVGGEVSADTIYQNTIRSAEGKDTVIVLLHSAAYAPGTLEAMPRIIEYFQQNGYRFGSLMDEDAPENWWFSDAH